MTSEPDVTGLLEAARCGDKGDLDRLFEAVYAELRRIAHARRGEWRGNDTLGTTALVHETYFKLVGQATLGAQDRRRFYALASKAMRNILIDYATMRRTAKRGSGAVHVSLDDNPISTVDAADELLAMDQALERLGKLNQRQCEVVEHRFFGGLSVQETAEALNVSATTVKRDWALASAWLHEQMV